MHHAYDIGTTVIGEKVSQARIPHHPPSRARRRLGRPDHRKFRTSAASLESLLRERAKLRIRVLAKGANCLCAPPSIGTMSQPGEPAAGNTRDAAPIPPWGAQQEDPR
jgi:hypothetical protein